MDECCESCGMRRIQTRCPSCGRQTLFVDRLGFLVCSALQCRMSLVDEAIASLEREAELKLHKRRSLP